MDVRLYGYVAALCIGLLLWEPYVEFGRIFSNLKVWAVAFLKLIINPKMLLTFGIAWMITNGWSYIFVFVGVHFHNKWLLGIGTAYQTFLWLPITPEKIVTIAIATVLARWWFPKDYKLQSQLQALNPKNIVK